MRLSDSSVERLSYSLFSSQKNRGFFCGIQIRMLYSSPQLRETPLI